MCIAYLGKIVLLAVLLVYCWSTPGVLLVTCTDGMWV